MAKRKLSTKEDARVATRRFIDQKGQLQDRTPKSVKERQRKGWEELEASLTPAQKKKMGIKTKRK